MAQEPEKIGRFDQVKLLTTRNVKYLSAPPGTAVSPQGIWSVAAVVNLDLIVVKGMTTIRIPATDVVRIQEYNVERIIGLFEGLLDRGESKNSQR